MINDALEPFGFADGRAERIVIMGENIRFSPKAALVLGKRCISTPARHEVLVIEKLLSGRRVLVDESTRSGRIPSHWKTYRIRIAGSYDD